MSRLGRDRKLPDPDCLVHKSIVSGFANYVPNLSSNVTITYDVEFITNMLQKLDTAIQKLKYVEVKTK